jgi:hypothetical protein
MDIRGLEALYSLRVEQNAHVTTKREKDAEIKSLRKTISEMTHDKKLTDTKLRDAEENLKRLKTGLPTLMCVRCTTLTTTEREKNDMLKMIDTCVALRHQLELDSIELIEAAVDPTPKERCECGYFRGTLEGSRCTKCHRLAGDPLPESVQPPEGAPKVAPRT